MIKVIFATRSAVFAAALLMLFTAMPSSAHTDLQSSVPADGQTIPQAKQLILTFGAPMRLMSVQLTDAAANSIELNFTRSTTAQPQFDIAVNQTLPAGTYRVNWIGMGEDGHKMEGHFSFSVDPEATAAQNTGHSEAGQRFSGLDHAAAKTVVDFHAALKAADTSAVRRLLAEEVIIFEGGGVERSRAEYESHHMAADMAFLQDLSVETLEHHVRVQGDSAVSMARSKVSGQFKGKQIDHTGMETITLHKREGNWQINHIHWSK